MDKIKTIVINEGKLIQNSGSIELTDDYIELIPKDTVARYLNVSIVFKNFRKSNVCEVPIIKINGELCPLMIQKDFEIKSEDKFQIESLMINNDFDIGNITMILVPNYMKNV